MKKDVVIYKCQEGNTSSDEEYLQFLVWRKSNEKDPWRNIRSMSYMYIRHSGEHRKRGR